MILIQMLIMQCSIISRQMPGMILLRKMPISIAFTEHKKGLCGQRYTSGNKIGFY